MASTTHPQDGVLTGRRLAVVFIAMMLSILLVALDQTILATALPRIASDFDAFSLQGWVSSAYILSQTVFILLYGQSLRLFAAKYLMLSSIAIFEVGSLVCGVSKNVDQLIAGRTVTGVGAAGIYVTMFQIISQVTRLEDRPRLFGFFGAVFGLSSVIGPLIGGAFTDHVTWRWCFLINLPVGGVSLVAVTFLLKAQTPLGADPAKRRPRDILDQFLRMDFFGGLLVAGFVTSLMLALQWGGNTKSWGNYAVIVSFVFAGVLLVALVFWEIFMKERAMVPTAIFHGRSLRDHRLRIPHPLLPAPLLLLPPHLYQAVRHRSATSSGVNLLPFVLGLVFGAIFSDQLVGRTGYYFPFLVLAPIFLGIGSGLCYTITPNISNAHIIGYQILAGIGTGLGMQNSLIAMQAEMRHDSKLLGQATSMASFAQFLGGTLGLGVAEPVFSSELSKYLKQYAPEAPASIVKESPTAIYTDLPAEMIPGVVLSYSKALRIVFVIGVPVAGIALISSVLIKNIRITPKAKGDEEEVKVEKAEL
ncbi:ABC transporter [Roridomyces roridus]|uniref:ABC transporter n=1 Tax=Roridomyces roridus TaxID=1738132 RepID=A0AAD7G047_9AGAR|nr:ABC transporter [Roridomyces roridus]